MKDQDNTYLPSGAINALLTCKVTEIKRNKDNKGITDKGISNNIDSIEDIVNKTNQASENIALAITKHRYNMYQGYLKAGFDAGQALYLLGLEIQVAR